MNRYVVDGRRFKDKQSAHRYLKRKFAFPEYYGNNADALYDCLSERKDMEIIIRYSSSIVKFMGGEGEKLISVFKDIGEREDISIVFA